MSNIVFASSFIFLNYYKLHYVSFYILVKEIIYNMTTCPSLISTCIISTVQRRGTLQKSNKAMV